ncbi:site-specific integrase [Psychrobacter arenosus]|uniref:site-specific integrase n=1 Tax=Psychrobacter arenosus TaxID=256326 RepID=UPI001917FCD4|nr:site-specific integrase [Psychrobacter arenosus]
MQKNEIDIPIITKEFAKYNSRRKKYVLLPSVIENPESGLGNQLFRYQLLSDLQTKWESLRQQSTQQDKQKLLKSDNNRQQTNSSLNKLKSVHHYYLQSIKMTFEPIERGNALIPYNSKLYNVHEWIETFTAHKKEFEAKITPLSSKAFGEFKDYAKNHINGLCKNDKQIQKAWQIVTDFIDFQNTSFMLAEHYYPAITAPKKIKLNPYSYDAAWVYYGKQLNSIVKAVNKYWFQVAESFKNGGEDYSESQIIGWLLFSGIVYGGINDKAVLKAWLLALINSPNIIGPFINERLLMSVRYEHKSYGNERIGANEQMFNTQQVILDQMSQCWLLKLKSKIDAENRQQLLQKISRQSLKSLITPVLQPVLEAAAIEAPPLTRLLKYASYHWEMLPSVSMDQASVSILKGRQNTTGLPKEDFDAFLDSTFRANPRITYNLNDIVLESTLASISNSKAANLEDSNLSARFTKAQVRKSDLIAKIFRAFEFSDKHKPPLPKNALGYKKIPPYLTCPLDFKRLNLASTLWKPMLSLNSRLLRLCKQYDDLSENILINWVYSLLNQKKAPNHDSIKKYIGSIGYEWLYFTVGQSLESWSEEDFEELYEDILEYKMVERGNKAVNQSANLYQRMHQLAVEKYALAPVTISQAGSYRRVRSELISPQAFKAIIEQLDHSLPLLEKDIFKLFFILLYRTGMRKKELLGLRYIDVEGRSSDQPSIVIRPNQYRSLKTQGSNRRCPVFALLKPAELELFKNYISTHIGNNPNKFIFTLSISPTVIDASLPLELLRRVLKDVSDDSTAPNHTLHGFRHTAISNLSLVLNGPMAMVEALTDYNSEDVDRIKKGLLGETTVTASKWYALSGLVGHLSPQRGFEYYNHIAMLMATYQLSTAKLNLPVAVFNQLTSITKKQLKENNALIEDEYLKLISARKLLFKKILDHQYRKSPSFAIEDKQNKTIDSVNRKKAKQLLQRYSLNSVVRFLEVADTGVSTADAAHQVNITIKDAMKIGERAVKVTHLKTIRGAPRFVKVDASNTPVLSPLNIQTHQDLSLLSILYTNALILRENSLTNWQWFITTASHKLTVTTPNLVFTKNEYAHLTRLMKIAVKLLPSSYWLIKGNQDLLLKLCNKKEFDGCKLVPSTLGTSVHLGIKSDSYKQHAKWQFSPVLRFLVHIMMVCDEELEIN